MERRTRNYILQIFGNCHDEQQKNNELDTYVNGNGFGITKCFKPITVIKAKKKKKNP